MSHNDSRIVSPGLPGEAADSPVREYVPPEGPTVQSVLEGAEDDAQPAQTEDTAPAYEFPYAVAGDHILVLELTDDPTTPGGLYIPEEYANKDTRAEVIVIGAGPHAVVALPARGESANAIGMEHTHKVQVGDTLIVHKNRWTTLDMDEREIRVLKSEAVIAVDTAS